MLRIARVSRYFKPKIQVQLKYIKKFLGYWYIWLHKNRLWNKIYDLEQNFLTEPLYWWIRSVKFLIFFSKNRYGKINLCEVRNISLVICASWVWFELDSKFINSNWGGFVQSVPTKIFRSSFFANKGRVRSTYSLQTPITCPN